MSPESIASSRIRQLTVSLLSLAAIVVAVATAEPNASAVTPLFTTAAMLGAALVTATLLARHSRVGTPSPLWIGIPLGLFGLLPAIAEPLRRTVGGIGQPGEVVLLGCMHNLLVGLVACCGWPRYWRTAALASLFAVVSAFSFGQSLLIHAVTMAYAVAGCLWLVGFYWNGPSRAQLVASRTTVWRPGIGLALLAGAGMVGLLAMIPGATVSGLLPELVPTSGGTKDRDPWARDGVHDGEALVRAAKDPRTTGFADSDLYLTSSELSLYDVLQDMYGEAAKPKRADRAVALPPSQIKETKGNPAHSAHAGREFSTRRAGRQRTPTQQDIRARALLYVSGRTPLHLRLSIYDRFDGVAWHEAPEEQQPLAGTVDRASGSIQLEGPARPPWFAEDESHTLKIGSLESARIPTPAHLAALKMENVNRLDFFAWIQHGIVQLTAAGHVPSGTVIDVRQRTVDSAVLEAAAWPATSADDSGCAASTMLRAPHPQVAGLAKRWTAGLPRGWQQVAAVVSAIRTHCAWDPEATAPAECDDVVAHFLFEAKRGPDYQFASATAVLLHTLGYPTRLVSGFYARPERFDASTRHTLVLPEDIHFWLEVRLPEGSWTTVEPTPGYAVAGTYVSWSRRAQVAIACMAAFVRRHVSVELLALTLAVVVGCGRRQLSNALATLLWHWKTGHAGAAAATVATIRLLDRRARLACHPRPPGSTPRDWFGPVAQSCGCAAEFDALLALADRAAYAPAGYDQAGAAAGPVRANCRLVVRRISLGALREPSRRSNSCVGMAWRCAWSAVRDRLVVRAWLAASPNVPLEIGESTL